MRFRMTLLIGGLLVLLALACGGSIGPSGDGDAADDGETPVVQIESPSDTPAATGTPLPTATPEPTATPAPTDTPEPTPSPPGVVFSDTFEGEDQRWQLRKDDDGLIDVVDEALRVEVATANLILWTLAGEDIADFAFEVDATWLDGPDFNDFGILFRYQDGDDHYRFLVDSDGQYTLQKYIGGELVQLVPWSGSRELNLGATTNRLGVVAYDNRIAIYANGDLLNVITDNSHLSGDVGLAAGVFDEAGLAVSFDNAKLFSAESEAVAGLPEPTPYPELALWADHFEDPGSGWFTGLNDVSQIRYAGGELEFQILETDAFDFSRAGQEFRDFALEIEVIEYTASETGSFGVVFRVQDLDNFYDFLITSNGLFLVERIFDGVATDLVSATQTEFLNLGTGESNRLKLIAVGDVLAFFVNDEFLIAVEDDKIPAGDIALVVLADQTNDPDNPYVVGFDNLVVWSQDAPQADLAGLPISDSEAEAAPAGPQVTPTEAQATPTPRALQPANTPTPVPPPPTPRPVPPTPTPVPPAANPLAPQPGRARMYLVNQFPEELTFTINNQEHRVAPNSEFAVDLDAGYYTYTISIPFGAVNGEVDMAPNQSWGVLVTQDGGVTVAQQLYP
jgi:hypothetical protein